MGRSQFDPEARTAKSVAHIDENIERVLKHFGLDERGIRLKERGDAEIARAYKKAERE